MPQICYPKPTDKPLYNGLVTQCRSLGIPFVGAEELGQQPLAASYDVVLDAMFGFSFSGAPRPPFDALIKVGHQEPWSTMGRVVDQKPEG
jgi:NAD(P)H-hydrate repair Nnr-like enzyme with NAD(P)H-hydrate epimerase domain